MIDSIFILDKSKTVVDILSNNGDSPQSPFFDDKYIQDLATGAETFEFTTIANQRTSKNAIAGNYVAFKYKNKVKMFQIIETKEEHEAALYKSCYCEIAGLELINNVLRAREIPSANVRQFMEIALADTDWKLGIVDAALILSSNIKIERPINVYSLIQQHLSTFDMEIEYRFEMTGNRISGMYIDTYKSRGRKNTGKRFEYGNNVSGVTKIEDVSELCTALVGIGTNDIDFKTVEWGADKPAIKPLNQDFIVDIEAHKRWNNNGSYIMGTYVAQTESPHELLTLTWNELQRRKQPKLSYDIQVEMLQGDEEEINIGENVKVIDHEFTPALLLTARIGRLELSFTDHTKNKCILTNFREVKSGILSIDTIQAIIDGKFPIGSDQIEDGAITDGKIDTEYLHTISTDILIAAKAEVGELIAGKADIEDLNAVNAIIENLKAKDAEIENAVIENASITNAEIEHLKAKDAEIGNLVADKADIEDLNAVKAEIGELEAGKADITDLDAVNATINHLKAGVAEIDTLLAGNLTADNIQAGSITAKEIATGTIIAGSGVIAEGAIGNAQISNLDAAKISAGTIDTSKVTVAGANSNLKLSGNRLQVFQGIGAAQVERVSVGDVNGDGSKYGLLVRGKDGKTVIMDENGVTNAGITDGSITNDKINSDANIDGAKININSVVNKINEDGSNSILGAKIEVDGTNLSTKLSNITTTQTEQGEKISQNSSKITANENAINLKVDSQTYQSDKEGIETQLNKNTAEIALNKEQIALKVEQTDINNAKSELEGKIDTKVNAAKSEIKITTDKISQSVSSLETSVTNKADGSTVTALSNKIGSLETSVNGIKGQVSSLETTTTTLNTNVSKAQSDATKGINDANTASDKAGAAQSTANSNKGSITNLQGEVTTVKSNVASIETNLDSITQRISSTESTTATLTGQVNQAQTAANNAQGTANTANNQANTNKTEISKTNNKVASIETTVSSITSRVESVETSQTTIDGKVTSLESWKKSAEQKITDDAIVNTVKSSKTDGKNTFAQQSDITQLDNSWTATFKEGYEQGIVSMNKDGINVSNSSSGTNTQINSSSFSVNDNKGGTVAEFARESLIPNLTAGKIMADEIYANNIASKSVMSGNINFIYVDGSTGSDNNPGASSSKLKTVQKAIDMLDDIINTNATIYVYNSVPGFELKGKTGRGVITISLQDSAIVNGRILLEGITNRINFTNESGSRKATLKGGLSVYNCSTVDIYGLAFRGKAPEDCNIFIRDTNYVAVNGCDLGGLSTTLGCAIKVQSSLLWLHGCIGSNITDVVGQYAFSHVMQARGGTSNCPDYKNGITINYDGAGRIQSWAGGTFTKTPSSGWNPEYKPTQKTQTWNFNKIWSDETLNGWPNKNELIQGYASTWNTGRWIGYMQFTDDMAAIRNTISGGTNLSGRLYVQRRTSSGNSTGSKLWLYASDGTVITTSTTINQGQGVWVTLNSSIISKIASGAIRYFYLRADSNNTSTYFKCESNPKIEITYTK